MKICLFDLEVSRSIVEGYGNKWDYKVVKMVRPQILMCYAYKFLGERRTHFKSIHSYKTYKEFVESLRDVLDESDIIIAHNLKKFDEKMSNRFFIKDDIAPPSQYRTIDTLQVARSTFKFEGNSLKDLCDYLDIGAKEKITYADLEDDFLSDKPKWSTLKHMEKYNKKDVILLEELYLKLRPYIKNHPNTAVGGNQEACPKCGGTNLQYRGYSYTNTSVYHRVQCQSCKGWFRERTTDKSIQNKPDFVN